MRGRAVPTMVWSSAARKSASPTPTVARIRALRVISPDIGLLLGHCFERVLHVGERGAKARALLGWEAREHSRDTQLHVVAIAIELLPATSGQLDEDDAPVMRVLESPHEAVAGEGIDLLRDRRRRHRAPLREIAAPHGVFAELPHHAGPVYRHRALLAAEHRRLEEARHGRQ